MTLRVNIGGARVADDGAPGEGDDIGDDVEGLTGGAGADLLQFTQAAGATGPPLLGLTGNAGRDRLVSDTATQTVFDPGIGARSRCRAARPATASSAATRSTTASTATAGSTATAPTCATARSRPRCEQVDQGAINEGPNVVMPSGALRVRRDGTVAVRLRCPRKLRIACKGSLAVRVDRTGSASAARAVSHPPRPRRTVRVKLPVAQRSRARRRGARLRLRSVEAGSHGTEDHAAVAARRGADAFRRPPRPALRWAWSTNGRGAGVQADLRSARGDARRGCHRPGDAPALELPEGFSTVEQVAGLDGPTALAYAPDGRLFVAEKAGRVRVVGADGRLHPTPVIDISDHVNSYRDRGLLGIAVDADFATNRSIYLLYVHEANALDPTGPKTSRLTRIGVTSDNELEDPARRRRSLLGSVAQVPCPAPADTVDCIPADGFSHAIGTVRADPDGTLWLGSGDADDSGGRPAGAAHL